VTGGIHSGVIHILGAGCPMSVILLGNTPASQEREDGFHCESP